MNQEPLVCNTNKGKHAGCLYGNHCCPSALHTAGHKRKRRTIKRGERQRARQAFRELLELEDELGEEG